MKSGHTLFWVLALACPAIVLAIVLAFTALAHTNTGDDAVDLDEQRFVAVGTDIPVMAGLVEDEAARVIFDKADGRIVEAHLFGPLPMDRVLDFYRESLAQLGWVNTGQSVSDVRYCREGERLTIRFAAAEGGVTVDFSLSPLPSGVGCEG